MKEMGIEAEEGKPPALAPVCLPDEVNRLAMEREEPDPEQMSLFAVGEGEAPKKGAGRETRRLLAPREP